MANIGSLRVFLNADTSKFRKGMTASQKQLARFRSGVNAVGTAGVVAFSALAAAAVSVTKAFAEQERVEAKLNAVLKATGNAAGFTTDQLIEQAAALQDVTAFGDEAIINTQALLATFKEIKGDEFTRATESVLDLATILRTEPKDAAIQLGKALNDPIKGITSLSRSGIQFTEVQKNVIKGMVEAGEVAEAQRLILEELEAQFGGVARAAGETLAGQVARLSNQWGDLKEAIGGVVVDLLDMQTKADGTTSKLKELTDWTKKNTKAISVFFQTLTVEGVTAFKELTEGGATFFESIFDGMGLTLRNSKNLFTSTFEILKALPDVAKGLWDESLPDQERLDLVLGALKDAQDAGAGDPLESLSDSISANMDALAKRLETLDKERAASLKKIMEDAIEDVSTAELGADAGDALSKVFGPAVDKAVEDGGEKIEEFWDEPLDRLENALNPEAATRGTAAAFRILAQQGRGRGVAPGAAGPIVPGGFGVGAPGGGGIGFGVGGGKGSVNLVADEQEETTKQTKKVKEAIDEVVRTLGNGINVLIQSTGIGTI